MEKIRSFIAIELSESIKKELAQLQEELKSCSADVKWTKPENIHLTLKFLGSVDEVQINQIKSILDKVASNCKPFKISLFKIGCFPKLDYPRVVWVGIDKGCSDAEAIAKDIEEDLSKIGFTKEKRSFSAHLTLGRVRSGKNRKNLVEKIKSLEFDSSTEMLAKEITLFKSTLTPKGSIYTSLHKSTFR